MRIWDQVDPRLLCRSHLLGEHRELHAIHNIVVRLQSKDSHPTGSRPIGYAGHPEVRRWVGRLDALRWRHVLLKLEMLRRGWQHNSELTVEDYGVSMPPPWDDQLSALKAKGCECSV